MPRNLPFYTRCAAPGIAYPWQTAGNWLQAILGGLVGAGIGVSVAVILAQIIGVVSVVGCAIGAGVAGFATIGILEFKSWYYNFRLMCIKSDQCACGTLVGEPHDAFDGDRKLDLHVAPFNVRDTEQLLIEKLDEMRATLPAVPDVVALQNRLTLFNYVRGLASASLKELYIRLVDEKLFTTAANSFQRHYLRRDEPIMGTPAFNASPPDTLADPDPNPMFRYTPEEGDDAEEYVLVPWTHCEVEGYRLGRFLDNLLAAVLTFLIAFLALCVVCDVLTLGIADWLCGILAGAIAALLAFLAWLFSNWVNDPDDAVAGEIDADVEDPDFDSPPSEMHRGDVVYVFGDWIMDEEHDNYFEIHPVKAYYLLCRGQETPEDWDLSNQPPASECAFEVRNLTPELMERLCRIVQAAETRDPDEGLSVTIARGLSMAPAIG